MSVLILLFMWLTLLTFVAFFRFKDIMAPAFFACASITVIILLFVVSQPLWPSLDYSNIVLVIGGSSLSFLLGAILGKYRFYVKNKKISKQKNIASYNLELTKNMLIFFSVIMYVLGAVSGSYRYLMSLVYKEAGTYESQLVTSNSFMEILYQILAAFTFVVIYSLIVDFVKKDFRHKWIKIFCLLPYNIVCFLSETRFPIFVEIMFAISCMNLIVRFEQGRNTKKVFSMLSKGLVIVIACFVGMAFLKIGSERNMVVYVLKYLTVGLYGLSHFLNLFSFSHANLGTYSFNNIYRVLNLFGFDINSMYSALGEHYWVNETFGAANLYTGLMTLIYDFDFLGAYIVIFIFGFVSTRLYYHIVCGNATNMTFMIIFYSSIMYLFVMIWIDLNPLNYLLSSSFIVRTIVIYVVLKIIVLTSKKKTNFKDSEKE